MMSSKLSIAYDSIRSRDKAIEDLEGQIGALESDKYAALYFYEKAMKGREEWQGKAFAAEAEVAALKARIAELEAADKRPAGAMARREDRTMMTHGMAEIDWAESDEAESEAMYDDGTAQTLATDCAIIKARVGQVANMAEIQSQDGNWNYSDYMRGLANGLLLAHATMTEGAYKPFSRPAQWIEEAKRTPPTEAPAP